MILNLTRGTVVAERAWEASSLLWRGRGMIGRDFDAFDALVFPGCGAIHMFFMTMPLDIVFLDASGLVVGLRNGLRPWRLAWEPRASAVIELPAGRLGFSPVERGDRLETSTERLV